MKEISVLKKLALISNLHVLGLVIVFLNLGCAMVMMIVSVSFNLNIKKDDFKYFFTQFRQTRRERLSSDYMLSESI